MPPRSRWRSSAKVALAASAFALAACSGSSSKSDGGAGYVGSGGSSGQSGQSGQSGSSGSAGTAGHGGSAGTAGHGGSGGTSGHGGSSGAGAAGGGPGGSGGHVSDASVEVPAPHVCSDGGAPRTTFSDDFSAGLRGTYWTVSQSTPGLYSVDVTQGDLRFAKIATNPNTALLQSVTVKLNLPALGGDATGDFDFSVDFSNAVFGQGGDDQIELHARFADSSIFYDVYDNGYNGGNGLNFHVWTGSINGPLATTAAGGTLRIARVGSQVSGYVGTTLLYATTSTSPLSGVEFVLQLYPGSDDDISARYDNFHFQSNCAPS